jgi:hypothetical protein
MPPTRFCDHGGCDQIASQVGTYTRLGEARTLAACCSAHALGIEQTYSQERYEIKWKAWPDQPVVTELGD